VRNFLYTGKALIKHYNMKTFLTSGGIAPDIQNIRTEKNPVAAKFI
jgi:hypothetical protein